LPRGEAYSERLPYCCFSFCTVVVSLEVVWDGGAVESGDGVVVVLLVVAVCSTVLLVVAGGLLATGAGGAACWQAPVVNPSAITANAEAYPSVNIFIC
jgi:hypothetical protein